LLVEAGTPFSTFEGGREPIPPWNTGEEHEDGVVQGVSSLAETRTVRSKLEQEPVASDGDAVDVAAEGLAYFVV
jgi:hypothetical protein